MSDTPQTRQVSIDEAAKALGLSRRTVERRLTSGRLRGVKHGARWLVEVPVPPQEGANVTTDVPPPPDTDALVADLAHTRDMLSEVRRQRDDLAEMVKTLTRQLEAGHEAQERADVERAELRRLLSQAQQLLLPAPATVEGTPTTQAEAKPRRAWSLSRLLRNH